MAGMKEDLNVVLQRDLPRYDDYSIDDHQALRGSMISGLSVKSRKSTAAAPNL